MIKSVTVFVLDGFIIEGNVLERTPLDEVKVKAHPFKRHYLAILVSIAVHFLLAFLLFFFAEEQQPKQVKITQKAIKSYLYKMPSKKVTVESLATKKVPEKNRVKKEVKLKKKPDVLESSKVVTNEPSTVSLPSKSKSISKIQKPIQATFSSYKQLDSLRNSINEKIISQGVTEFQQFRSPSVMHGEQIPVPHSTKKLSPEQEREKNITKMSDDISITKYDNGLCTIERKQFIGSPVEGSIAAFACGESKFDKGFRDHMKKVRNKIMPVKNK
jgi:hypothetical protein